MSVEAQVRAAKTPGEALLILARAVDELRTYEVQADDPWAIPDGLTTAERAIVDTAPPAEAIDPEVWTELGAKMAYESLLEQLGERPADPDEAQAWQAQRELAKDMLRPPTPDIGVTRSQIETVMVDTGSFQVQVPTATEEQRAMRAELAPKLGLDQPKWWTRNELALETDAALAAYELGGPLWLVAYDRDFVMQLPPGLRQAMVEDLLSVSPDDAHELARDILKDTTPDGRKGVQMEWLEREHA